MMIHGTIQACICSLLFFKKNVIWRIGIKKCANLLNSFKLEAFSFFNSFSHFFRLRPAWVVASLCLCAPFLWAELLKFSILLPASQPCNHMYKINNISSVVDVEYAKTEKKRIKWKIMAKHSQFKQLMCYCYFSVQNSLFFACNICSTIARLCPTVASTAPAQLAVPFSVVTLASSFFFSSSLYHFVTAVQN